MTSTALAAYNRVADMTAFTRELGDSIAKSQMFGCESYAQGHVLAVACVAKGVDPLSLVEKYHIIQGRLSMRADAMLAGLQERGGKYRVIDRSADRAAIEITHDGQTQVFSLSWEEAEKEPFVRGKKGQIKDNWSTPRSRMQMLWARVVSDGVRTMCPIVLVGKYTPEEIGDFAENEDGAVEVQFEVKPVTAPAPAAAPQQPGPVTAESNADQENDGFATGAQRSEIKALFDGLGITHEQQETILRKRGVSNLRSLTLADAQDLLEKLREKAAASGSYEQSVDDPCDAATAERIKQQLGELAQSWDPEIAAKVKARLVACGLQKISDLSIAEARTLEQALALKQMESFFDLALRGHQRPSDPQPGK